MYQKTNQGTEYFVIAASTDAVGTPSTTRPTAIPKAATVEIVSVIAEHARYAL